MPTSVFLTTCLGIDSIAASRSNDPFVPIVATKSGESIWRAIRENANFLSIEGAGKGSVGNSNRTHRWSHPVPRQWGAGSGRSIAIDRQTPCALLSVGKTRCGGDGGWDDERRRDSGQEVSVSGDGCGPS